MYQVIIKGKTLQELRKAISDIDKELSLDVVEKSKSEKDVSQDDLDKEIMAMIDVPPVIVEEPLKIIPSEPSISSEVIFNSPDVELDSEGLPWVKSIHASSRAKIADGTWRIKRGVDDATANAIKQLLREKINTIKPEQVVPNMETRVPEVVENVTPIVQPVMIPPTLSNGHTLDTFKQNFPMVLADLINRKIISQEYIETLKNYFGVLEIWQATDIQKEELFNSFVSYNFIQKVG